MAAALFLFFEPADFMFALFNVFAIFRKAVGVCQDELLRLTLLLCVAGVRGQGGGLELVGGW